MISYMTWATISVSLLHPFLIIHAFIHSTNNNSRRHKEYKDAGCTVAKETSSIANLMELTV